MIILFERNIKESQWIKKFLFEKNIFSCVVVDFEYFLSDFLVPEFGTLDENDCFVERKDLVIEINILAGPVIFHGRHKAGDKIFQHENFFKLSHIIKRRDTGWVEKVNSPEFINLYWNIMIKNLKK